MLRSVIILTLVVFWSASAWAHGGSGATSGLVHGLEHPVSGADHLLAMVTVGLLAWIVASSEGKRRALWLVPAAFVATMIFGGILGAFAVSLPYVEVAIALSAVAFGLLVVAGGGVPLTAAMAVVAFFALFHGHAHGTEMPGALSGVTYGIGFALATALLHGFGVLLGIGLARLNAARGLQLVRAGGAATALAGCALLVGVL